MKKTILLGEKGMISANVSKWLFGVLGLLWLVLGIMKIYEEGTSIGSVGYLVIAFVFIVYSILVFTINPLAPKVIISDHEIKIKRKVISNAIHILWNDIKTIEFDHYKIVFHLSDGLEEFTYRTNADISIEVKSSIREIAEKKHIEVTGG